MTATSAGTSLAVIKYKFSQHMTGHLWSEFLFPGDYYVNRDVITSCKAEVMFVLIGGRPRAASGSGGVRYLFAFDGGGCYCSG